MKTETEYLIEAVGYIADGAAVVGIEAENEGVDTVPIIVAVRALRILAANYSGPHAGEIVLQLGGLTDLVRQDLAGDAK